MKEERGLRPQAKWAKCPFYVVPGDVHSAEASVKRCVGCVTCGHSELKQLSEDFRQTAYMTILEESPKYDPGHASGASFITFIKAHVCGRLWHQRRQELKYVPFSHTEAPETDDAPAPNPLVSHLIAEACARETLEDDVIRELTVEELRSWLPGMLSRLTEKERAVVKLTYFQDAPGVEIAEALGVSEGRVSQLKRCALAKLRKAYLRRCG